MSEPTAEQIEMIKQIADLLKFVILAERERCAKICEAEAEAFLSPQYATNQPLGSFCERFACEQCAAAIRKETE